MAIPTNMKGISDFLADQRKLIDQIQDTAEGAGGILSGLFDQLQTNKDNAEKLVAQLKTVEFQAGKTDDVKARQKELIDAIEAKEQEIQDAAGDLHERGQLKGELATLYMNLGDTFTESVARIVSFTPEEEQQLRNLLEEATVDTAKRQSKADILAAVVSLTKLAIKVAKMVAA